jgi:ATP-binding cassette, subfamily B, bacterial
MKVKQILTLLKWVYKQSKNYRLVVIVILISNLISSLIRLILAVLTKGLIDTFITSKWKEAVNTILIFLIIVLMQIGFKMLSKILTTWNLESMANKIRSGLYEHLTRSSWLDYKKFHSGDILTRITSDTTIVTESIIKEIPESISQVISLVVAFIVLCFYDPVLAVFGMVAGPIILFAGLIFSTKFLKIYSASMEAESNFRAFAQESLEHMLIVKTFCHESESQKQLNQLLSKKMKLSLKRKAVTVISGFFVVIVCCLLYLPIVIKEINELTNGIITYGDLATYIQLLVLIQSPLLTLTNSISGFTATGASVKRLMELDDLKTEQFNNVQISNNLHRISMEDVNFHYLEEISVLHHVNMQITTGDIIGLMGRSGEGKTTLIHLLMQILTPCGGNILVQDYMGEDYRVSNFMRNYISYVPQGNTLFSGTISQNLLLGKSGASEEEQIIALKKAYAWDFVKKAEKGLYTKVGERGMGLSEGQAQRISIARALLRNAPILILDEATSALDGDTERLIIEEIISNKNLSLIMITHRTSILSYCNRIWKLDKGILTEEASIKEVAATRVT